MRKVILIPFLLYALFSCAQPPSDFPYKGGIAQLENDISSVFAEAKDSGRVFFAEIIYHKKERKFISVIHGAAEYDVTKKMIADFFQRHSGNWDKKALQKNTIVIPLFIEGFNTEEGADGNAISLMTQQANISFSFTFKKCILSRPLVISKSAIHIDMESPD